MEKEKEAFPFGASVTRKVSRVWFLCLSELADCHPSIQLESSLVKQQDCI